MAGERFTVLESGAPSARFTVLEGPKQSLEPRTTQADLPQGVLANIPGALKETLGAGNRPGARNVGQVIADPQGVAEHLASGAVTIPLMAGAQMVAPVAGPMTVGGALGALRGMDKGHDLKGMGVDALVDAALVGLTEGAGAGARGALTKLGGKAREATEEAARRSGAYQWATEAPGKALEALKDRLANVKAITVPSLGDGKMTVDAAVKKLSTLTGSAYEQGLAELKSVLNRVDKQRLAGGPRPYAGTAFGARVSPQRFPPSAPEVAPWWSRAAEAAKPAVRGSQSTADALAVMPVYDVPGGALAGAKAAETPGMVGRMIPGVGHLLEMAAH